MVVLESTNVTLNCKASGYPEPYVMWRREDGEDIRYNGENGERTYDNFRLSVFVFVELELIDSSSNINSNLLINYWKCIQDWHLK